MISHIWQAPLDPKEVKDYTLGFEPELTARNPIDSLTDADWALDAAAIAAGIEIHASSLDGQTATVWLKVAEAQQGSALFDDPGTTFTADVTAISTNGRTYHRTCQFTVQKQ